MKKRRATASATTTAPTQNDAVMLEALLRERARTLADRVLEQKEPAVYGTVVVARRLGSSLGFPMDSVREVRTVRTNRLPHVKPSIAGLFQLRGVLHVLVDAKAIVGEGPALAHGDTATTVVLEHEGRCLGIRVDEVIGPRLVLADELDGNHADRQLDLVAEITRDCVEILDVHALFHSPDIRMDQKP